MMDELDVMCLTCGQSPDMGSPPREGEWDDYGHDDGAHTPNWVTMFGESWDRTFY